VPPGVAAADYVSTSFSLVQ